MDVACPNCPAMYPISEQKLAGRLVRFRCKACGQAIVLDGRGSISQPPFNPSNAPGAPPAQDSIPVSALYPTGSPSAATPGSATRTLLQHPSPVGAPPSEAPPSAPLPSGSPQSAPLRSAPQVSHSSSAGAPPANHRFTSRGPVRDPELDPSVYEDETVAMTAHELEAVADAKSHHPSAAPPQFVQQPPPKPSPSIPSPALPLMMTSDRSETQATRAPSSGRHPPLPSNATPPPQPSPRRAESWRVEQPSPPPAPSPAPNPHHYPAPPPVAHRHFDEASPPLARPERRWVFPVLLVLLGAGGLVLGGLLGRTWLAKLWGSQSPPSVPVSAAPSEPLVPEAPALPPFDAHTADVVLEQAASNAVHCLNADTAPLSGVVSARFSTSGKLETLSLSGSVAEATESPCIRSVFEKIEIEPFGGNPAVVEKPVELRPRP